MNLDEAKKYLGDRYVLSPRYKPDPRHSAYAIVDVRRSWARAQAPVVLRLRPSLPPQQRP